MVATGRSYEDDGPNRRRRNARGGRRASSLQGIALLGVVERNAYLVKRYGYWELAFFAWTVADALTIVFIAKGVEASGGRASTSSARPPSC